VIASQALISGVFSLTAQAQDLRFFPRLHTIHTSRDERGQVYVPLANWLLAAACVLLVVTFRKSENLAAAYGLAVVCTMVITTLAIGLVARRCWRWPLAAVGGFVGVLIAVEGFFLVSSLLKLAQGAYFPLLIGGGLLTVMLTWYRGRAIISERVHAGTCPVDALLSRIPHERTLPGQLVMITLNKNPAHAVARLQEMIRQGIAPREQIIFLSLLNVMQSDVDMARSIKVHPHDQRVWHVIAEHGYMQEPRAADILDRAVEISGGGIATRSAETFFVLPRELIVEYTGAGFARWRRVLYGVLARNQSYAPDYFFIPHAQLMEFTWVMKA